MNMGLLQSNSALAAKQLSKNKKAAEAAAIKMEEVAVATSVWSASHTADDETSTINFLVETGVKLLKAEWSSAASRRKTKKNWLYLKLK